MPASGQTYAFVPGTGGGCGAPFNVGASAVTGTTASVAFQGPAAATGYVLTYQAAGGPVQTLTPAPMASPVTLSGLQPGTAYTVTVAATYGAGQTSAATSATFTTAAGYCVTGLGGACGPDNILAVNIVGTTLNASGLTCTSAGPPPQAYASYPASDSTSGSIARGQSYQLSVTTGTTDIVSGWIDYDHSLTFDASEWVLVAMSSTTNTASVVSVAVPTNAVLGATTLRVRSRRAGNANGATDACTSFGLADTKDFVVTIVAPGGLRSTQRPERRQPHRHRGHAQLCRQRRQWFPHGSIRPGGL